MLPSPRLRRGLWRTGLSALLASLAVGAASLAAAAPALWKVQGPHATVWLFGTTHILRPDMTWRDPALDAAFKASDALYLEVPDIDDQAEILKVIETYGVDPRHPLSTKLNAAQMAALNKVLAAYGASEAQFNGFRPWLAATVVEALPLIKAGFDPKSGVEMTLMKDARAGGKPIKGFETEEEQARYFADLPPQDEIDFLMSSVSDADKGLDDVNRLVADWLAGDVAGINTLVNEDIKAQSPELYRILIVERNQRFAKDIAALAQGSGTYFVALGAGHFAGPDSVQADLSKLGLAATRQ